MNEENDFARAILASPQDASIRLVWADWLDEHNDLRASGIRSCPEWCLISDGGSHGYGGGDYGDGDGGGDYASVGEFPNTRSAAN